MYQRQYKKIITLKKKILWNEINNNASSPFQKVLPESAKSCQNQLKSDAVLDDTTRGTHHLHKDKSQAGCWIKYKEKRRRKTQRIWIFARIFKYTTNLIPSTNSSQFEFAAQETSLNLPCTSYLPATAAPILQTAWARQQTVR